MQHSSTLSGISPQKIFLILFFSALRKFLIFFGNGNPEKILYISEETETKVSHISRKVYSEPQHIQNYDIFRTRDIFRTMTYLEPETYSEHHQTSAMKRFAKIATQRTFWPKLKENEKFSTKKFIISGNETFQL